MALLLAVHEDVTFTFERWAALQRGVRVDAFLPAEMKGQAIKFLNPSHQYGHSASATDQTLTTLLSPDQNLIAEKVDPSLFQFESGAGSDPFGNNDDIFFKLHNVEKKVSEPAASDPFDAFSMPAAKTGEVVPQQPARYQPNPFATESNHPPGQQML